MIKRFNINTIRRTLSLMDGNKNKYLLLIYGFCIVEFLCTVFRTIGTKGILNSITDHDSHSFMKFIIIFCLGNVIWWVYSPISTYITGKISQETQCEFIAQFTEHLVRMPMSYLDKKATGDLLSVYSNDMQGFASIYNWFFSKVLLSATGGAGSLLFMAVIDWRFAIVVFTLGSISVILTSHFSKKLEQIGEEKQASLSKTSLDAYELIKSAKTIRHLHVQKWKLHQFNQSARNEAKIKTTSGTMKAKMDTALCVTNSVTYILILLIGAMFVYKGMSDWGTVVALTGLKFYTDMLFVECGQYLAGMQDAVTKVKRVFEILDEAEESIQKDDQILETNRGKNMETSSKYHAQNLLEMHNVTFAYDEKEHILEDFNFNIKDKTLTALIGESGSGKSTVMKLILGFYNVIRGDIICTETLGKKHIREVTAYVPQDAYLFHGTISENIAFGNETATKEEIIAAAKLAGADEFINKMSDGYDTLLLESGNDLSGGQKQRISIARALLKDAPILLLDEITSALDKEHESALIESIKEISKQKAVLFITRKENVEEWADEVIRVGSV